MNKVYAAIFGFLALMLAGWQQPALAELAIIAHPQNPLMGMGKEELRELYRGGRKSLASIGTLEVVDQADGTPAREKFNSDVLEMTESQRKSYWSSRMFTGKGKPPQAVGDDTAVRDWVAAHPNGIGYITGSQVNAGVKVLLILP